MNQPQMIVYDWDFMRREKVHNPNWVWNEMGLQPTKLGKGI